MAETSTEDRQRFERAPGAAEQDREPPESGGSRGRRWAPWIVIGAIALVVAIAIVAVVVDGGEEVLDNPSAAEIVEDPALYAGRQVTVTGQVAQVYQLPPVEVGGDPRVVFALQTQAEDPLYVTGAGENAQIQVSEGQRVQVQGTVQGFYAGGFRSVFGGIPSGAAWGTSERPVLLATDVAQASSQATS